MATPLLDTLTPLWQAFKTAASPALASYVRFLPITLTKKVTVASLEASGSFPQVKDLWDGVLIALLLTLLRLLLTPTILEPFGQHVMQQKYSLAFRNGRRIPRIDNLMKEAPLPLLHAKQALAKELNMSLQEVTNYMRQWRNAQREGKLLHKFTEVAWKLLVHVAITYCGVQYILLAQPYAKDLTLCWKGYPFTPLNSLMYWYALAEFGIYVHEFVYHFLEQRRSDFVEMLIHHIATLALIAGSFIYNYVAIGTLVMIIHDAADSLLELAKLFNYVSNVHKWAQVVTDTLFVCFAVTFFLTRCVAFPFYILRHTFVFPYTAVPEGTVSITVLNVFLGVLLLLHIFWMSLIVKMAVKMMMSGEAPNDERSDDESYIEPSMVRSKSEYEKED